MHFKMSSAGRRASTQTKTRYFSRNANSLSIKNIQFLRLSNLKTDKLDLRWCAALKEKQKFCV